MKHFIPVKITDKKWADKLVQGEIFMRAIHEFGLWGNVNEKDNAVKNNYRGDVYSGVTATFKSPEDSDHFAGLDSELKKVMKNCCLIDESDIQFFKIYSLYCYELDDKTQTFKKPDSRMAQFGDTAVLIIDFCEFLDRYARALFKEYEPLIALLDHVQPFDFSETRYLNPLFCKHISQAYQNELRLAFGQLEKNVFARGVSSDNALSLIQDLSPVLLHIGDISDITVELPIDDFMQGKLPDGFRCHWPSSDSAINPSNYDTIRKSTIEQMKNYRSIMTRATFSIC